MTKQPRKPSSNRKTKSSPLSAGTRAGMPAADSVEAVVDFVAPGNRKYRILKTSEHDAYDQLKGKGETPKKPKQPKKPS